MSSFIYPVKPMLPTLSENAPTENTWLYEPKYDGYRVQLIWSADQPPRLFSRGLKDLTICFPEIVRYAKENEAIFAPFFPLALDGELCVINQPYKASFSAIQKRGKTQNKRSIDRLSREMPGVFIGFDVLYSKKCTQGFSYLKRRSILDALIQQTIHFHCQFDRCAIVKTETFKNPHVLWNEIKKYNGEGIVAKKTDSVWTAGKRTEEWLKIKNPQSGVFILSGLNRNNGYFHVSLLKDGDLCEAGSFSHGLQSKEREALHEVIVSNQILKTSDMIYIKPGICVELTYLEWSHNKLRHPRFKDFRLDVQWEACTWESSRQL